MRLLHLNHNVAGTGTYQRAFHLAREAVRRGHDATLVTTSRRARLAGHWREAEGVRILESPDLLWGRARTGWDPWSWARRIGLLAGASFDLVYAFDGRPAVIVPALALARRSGAALFMDWADWWGRGGTIEERSGPLMRMLFGGIETWFEEAFRQRACGCTVISRALEERCAGLGVARERILRFSNGCESPPADAPARAEARLRLGIGDDVPLVVHLGAAHAGDQALLFEAFAQAARELPSARLALVGGLRGRLSRRLAAAGRVITTGFIPRGDVRLWLAAATVCVVTLRDNVANRGRWPGKLNEYLTAGRACVLPHVGDAGAVVREAGAGWTCAPDATSFGASLAVALADRAGRSEAEARARELAAGPLHWSAIGDRVDDFQRALSGAQAIAAA